jgi:hypothetical protein
MMHNHPSGDPTPSNADIQMTKQILDIAGQLGICPPDLQRKDGPFSCRQVDSFERDLPQQLLQIGWKIDGRTPEDLAIIFDHGQFVGTMRRDLPRARADRAARDESPIAPARRSRRDRSNARIRTNALPVGDRVPEGGRRRRDAATKAAG